MKDVLCQSVESSQIALRVMGPYMPLKESQYVQFHTSHIEAAAADLVWPFQERHLVSELMGRPERHSTRSVVERLSDRDRYHTRRLS